MLDLARDFAGLGAVVIAIDAPFARRASGEPVLFTTRDRRDQIQLKSRGVRGMGSGACCTDAAAATGAGATLFAGAATRPETASRGE